MTPAELQAIAEAVAAGLRGAQAAPEPLTFGAVVGAVAPWAMTLFAAILAWLLKRAWDRLETARTATDCDARHAADRERLDREQALRDSAAAARDEEMRRRVEAAEASAVRVTDSHDRLTELLGAGRRQ